ncbi:MAG: histidine kinase dimerization/phospho-acceptor domain-containing protein [Candidatus Pacebacteria bacterium]|nr:histidine kinase dimerization/phospho-acceptor domain-containing protein [Candidatus Paceibacterota bacterium]
MVHDLYIGILELTKEKVEGEFVVLLGNEVRYSLSCKRIVFTQLPATLFMLQACSNTERTHQRLMEERYRGVILSTVTHELKTPLTVISGNLELVQRNVRENDEDRLRIEAAVQATKALKYYIHDINVTLAADIE